jgi:hypothetical protein
VKKLIKPGVQERAEYVCDVTGKPAVAELRLSFWYEGGEHDKQELHAHLSRETASQVLALLQTRFPSLTLKEWAFLPHVSTDEVTPFVMEKLLALARRQKRPRKTGKRTVPRKDRRSPR